MTTKYHKENPSCQNKPKIVERDVGMRVLNTITIKFLNPIKLGATSEPWLKQEARECE